MNSQTTRTMLTRTTKQSSDDFENEEYHEPLILKFPWIKAFGILFLLIYNILFVYRISSTAGKEVEQACFAAMITASVSGLLGFYLIIDTWSRDIYRMLSGVFISMIVRLLTCAIGFAIIILFTGTNRSWFVLFLIIYYLAFLSADTLFASWVLRNSDIKVKKDIIHGSLWDAIS